MAPSAPSKQKSVNQSSKAIWSSGGPEDKYILKEIKNGFINKKLLNYFFKFKFFLKFIFFSIFFNLFFSWGST